MPNSRSTIHHIPSTEHLSNEIKFLIACCQVAPSEKDINFIFSYLNAERLDLNALISLANQHGIFPLVYKTIKKIIENNSPNATHDTLHAQILTELKAQYMSISQRNMLMTSELIKIMHLLRENHIEALAFKGPTLAQLAYGDITLRQYSDLDILLNKKDIYKIDTLLKDRGYQRLLKITPTQESIYMQTRQDLGFYHPKNGQYLEMHWSLLNDDYPVHIKLDTIWKSPQTISINQEKIKTFPNEELLTYLCIHGSKHLWERIEWIKDIDLLVRKGNIDWQKVIRKVEGSNFKIMMYLGLSLAIQLFETPLPKYITNQVLNMKIVNSLSYFVFQNWQRPKNTFQKTHAKLKFFPGIKKRVKYLHKILFKPSLNDLGFINLPKVLYWVYYFIRPYRVIKKYLIKKAV